MEIKIVESHHMKNTDIEEILTEFIIRFLPINNNYDKEKCIITMYDFFESQHQREWIYNNLEQLIKDHERNQKISFVVILDVEKQLIDKIFEILQEQLNDKNYDLNHYAYMLSIFLDKIFLQSQKTFLQQLEENHKCKHK